MAAIEAVIDVGTNTVLLLVAKLEGGVISNLIEDSRTTRLGHGLQKSGTLSQDAIDKTLKATQDFLQIAAKNGARTTYIVATSAVRDAKNRELFEEQMCNIPSSNYATLSGEEEAQYTFWGAASNQELRRRKLRVVDVGGGSTELISGASSVITNMHSIDIGHVRLTETLKITDPIADSKIRELTNHVNEKLRGEHLAAADEDEMLVGVGGTFTTLAQIDMAMEKYDADRIQGYGMARNTISALREKMQNVALPDRRRISGLSPTRADVIVAGAAIVESIMQELRFDEMKVSTRGLRHGVLVQKMQAG